MKQVVAAAAVVVDKRVTDPDIVVGVANYSIVDPADFLRIHYYFNINRNFLGKENYLRGELDYFRVKVYCKLD